MSFARIIILVVGLVVYANALANGFVWDDFPQLVNYELHHSIGNLFQILGDHTQTFYRPVPAVVWAALYTVFGPVAFWYHLVQVGLHMGIVMILFTLYRKYFTNHLALVLALMFLVHPINVEVVAYISAMQTTLSLLFGLLALIVVQKEGMNPVYKYGWIVILLGLAIFSKESAVVFPVYLLGIKLVGQKSESTDDKLRQRSRLMIIGLALVYVGTWMYFGVSRLKDREAGPVSPVPIMRASGEERLRTFPKLFSYYLTTWVYPKDLAISQQWLVKKINAADFFIPMTIAGLFMAGGIGAGIYLYKIKANQFRLYLFFAFWLMTSWAVSWQIIPLNMTVADRWFYAPGVGLLGMLGCIFKQVNVPAKFHKYLGAGLVLVILGWSIRTIVRNSNWENNLTLFSHDRAISNQSYEVEDGLANAYMDLDKFDLAKPHLEKSIQLAPHYWANWNNLGVYYQMTGEVDQSIQAFMKAIENNDNYYLGYVNLVRVYFYQKSLDETNEFLTKIALPRFNNDKYFRYIKGQVESKLGENLLK